MFAVFDVWGPTVADGFYDVPASIPATPGALLRVAPLPGHESTSARAWRILYTTTREQGTPAVASAVVAVARGDLVEPRPIIAWAHGTTGIVADCAPSRMSDPLAQVPDLAQLIAQGWIYVGADYAGLGVVGEHPYLIGEGEARSVLDAVRAARQIPGLNASAKTVVWGHSQGGHAALWTGIIARRYAPDVALAGVVAIAPASDLGPLVEAVQSTVAGRITSSYLLRGYSDAYPEVRVARYTSGWQRLLSRHIAQRCIQGKQALLTVLEAVAAGGSIFTSATDQGPLALRLAQNTPDGSVAAPLLIAQGQDDDLVLASVQEQYVVRRCAAGQALTYRRYARRDHLSIVAADSPLREDMLRWTEQRLAGVAPPDGCVVQNR
jgi:alpha-beta hydrolase superfamily lysophospholipase